MKVGINSIAFAKPFPEDPYDLFKTIKDIGFDLVEIMDSDDRKIHVSKVLRAAEKTGIEISLLAFSEFIDPQCGDISSTEPEKRAEGMRYAKSMIDIAVQLGIDKLSNVFFAAVGKTGPKTPEEKAQQWDWAVEALKIITEYAGERGIFLAIEPCDRFDTDMINTVEQTEELIRRIGNQSNLGYHVDTYHMQYEERDLEEAIIRCGDKLKTIHACGNGRQAPGYDNFDWEAIRAGCRKIGFDGELTIEGLFGNIPKLAAQGHIYRTDLNPYEEAEKGLRFLRTFFDC